MRKPKPRYIPIVTSDKVRPFRVYDRLTGESFGETGDQAIAQTLAAEYSEKYPAPPWYQRIAHRFRLFLQPTPTALNLKTPPANIEPWQRKIRRLNALIEQRKLERRLANGGRIVEPPN